MTTGLLLVYLKYDLTFSSSWRRLEDLQVYLWGMLSFELVSLLCGSDSLFFSRPSSGRHDRIFSKTRFTTMIKKQELLYVEDRRFELDIVKCDHVELEKFYEEERYGLQQLLDEGEI
ncbi:unnamed protein product [Amoebophrya sp. A25]|nr:unnamed protein product [Amoebophrya sp. A25]|eukprot:GSA25T00012789001.1